MIDQPISIREMFAPRGLIRGGILLLNSEEATAMVREAYARKINILGVDAFFVSEHMTRPSMELSRNFTTETGVESNNHQLAEEHILHNAKEGALFEVVLDDD